jgi:heptosyltransferase-2
MKPKKILVVRYRFIGDTILTVPFLRNLQEAYPEAKIDVLVGPVSGEVLQGCPYVNELIYFDTTRFHKYDSGAGKPRNLFSYLLDIRSRRYDMVFVLKRSFTSRLIAFASGARVRAGYVKKGVSPLLTRSVPFNPNMHEVDSLLSVLEACNLPVTSRTLEAFVSAQEIASVYELEPRLAQSKNFVLIHAASAHPDKLYPLNLWGDLLKRLVGELGLFPVFSGDKQDQALYKDLMELAGLSEDTCLNMAGRLSLRQSIALYSRMKLGVCVDSGPAHLLAAMQVPSLTLFGPTDPLRWRPYGEHCQAIYREDLECRPCHYRKICDDRPCLTELPCDFIFEKCLNVMQSLVSEGRQ